MIDQILADFRKVMHKGNSVLCKLVLVTNSGQHQKLWRINRTARQYDFAAVVEPELLIFAGQFQGYANCPFAAHHHAGYPCVRQHIKIGSLLCATQKCLRGAPATTIFLCHLVKPQSLLCCSIKIRVYRQIYMRGCSNKITAQWIDRLEVAYGKLAALAMVRTRTETLVIFQPAKQFQCPVPSPQVGSSLLAPVVIIGFVASDIDHGINRRGAAKRLPPRPKQPTPFQILLSFGFEGPV